jgi:hypothetical protein
MLAAPALDLPRTPAVAIQRHVGLLGDRPLALQLGAAAPRTPSSAGSAVQRATSTVGARPAAGQAVAGSASPSTTHGRLAVAPPAARVELLPPEVTVPARADRFAHVTGYEPLPAVPAPALAGRSGQAVQRSAGGPHAADRPARVSQSDSPPPAPAASAVAAPLAASPTPSAAPLPMPVASVQRTEAPEVQTDLEASQAAESTARPAESSTGPAESSTGPAVGTAIEPSGRSDAVMSPGGGSAGASGAGSPHPGAELDPTELDRLAGRLLGPLTRRIKAEMVIDRERRGLRSDPR